MNRYTVSSLIGEGSFGRVYRATHKNDATTVAIKIISKRGRSSKELKDLRRECDIQSKLKHPNVIEMFESFETKNDIVVVTEFALIDLHRYLVRNGALLEERARLLICHLVSALYYLHSNRILHRDLKPQNVLLNQELHVKLCDFGLARNMTMGTHVLTSIKGTPLYMAPELLAERPYDHHADLWSLGCIAYETMAGQPPFCTTSILHLVKLIKHEEVKWPSFLSSDCRSFLQGLLEKDPSMRITWAQILCHPFVDGKLYISGIKADNSPFINPQIKNAVATVDDHSIAGNNGSALEEIASYDAAENSIAIEGGIDNLSSSRDSINAIPPSDIENLETDMEDNANRVTVPFAESAYRDMDALPSFNANSGFMKVNSNMILNYFNDNFNVMTAPATTLTTTNPLADNLTPKTKMNVTQGNAKKGSPTDARPQMPQRSKDLEKRKLSQNLDNFSLRLGQSIDVDAHRKATEMLMQKKERDKDKESRMNSTLKTSVQSIDDKHSSENSPPCLLPGWDSCDESQSPPIENEEWLAFLNRSIQEVLDGELDSLKQHNLVSIIVAPLRNSKATPKVVECVAQLLSLPLVLGGPASVIEMITTVYVEVKLVPNLMYASKLLICHPRNTGDSAASLQQQGGRTVRRLDDLNSDELRTASQLYEFICHLVHVREQFLLQFCDAMAILAADELFINCLTHDFTIPSANRISNSVLALLCCVVRELPENADLVEKIVSSSKLDLVLLLGHKDDLLRLRTCMLLRLLGRFSLCCLQTVWSANIRDAVEQLTNDINSQITEEAENTVDELRQFSFYA